MPKVEQLQQSPEQQQQQQQQQPQRCDYDYDDFTYIPNMVFKSMGYDFLSGSKPLWQHLLLSAYFGLGFIINCYISYYMILRILQWDTLSGNPKLIMRYAIMVFVMLNSDVKFFAFVAYRRRLRLLNSALKRLYPSEQRKRLDYEVNKYFWSKFFRYCLYLYYFAVLLVILGPFTQTTVSYLMQRHKLGKDDTFQFIRAYPMELGFSTKTLSGYVIATIVESAFSLLTMNVNLGTDLWLVCLSTQISMHFDHVAKKLNQYNPSNGNEQENHQFVIDLVNEHQLIFSLHKELNHLFGVLLAYNLFSTASSLCCVALYTIVQGLNLEGLSFLLFFFTTAAQFYVVCHSGQILIDSSNSIAAAAYKQNWYDSATSYKKSLLLILMRAQKPAELSARGIIIISLDTFTILINITFRFFAVVRTVLAK